VVIVYTKPSCPACYATKRALDKRGIPYQVIDVTQSPEALSAVKALGYRAMPVVTVGDEHWCDFRPDLIETLGGER
tara:strand:- start:1771 stop:1998 length:228 start_codon:yes stop_codon:yes gene_type:complete